MRSVHQYAVFCLNNLLERTISLSLQHISKPEVKYHEQCALRLNKNRNTLLKILLKSKYNFKLWIPQGGYFVLADISECEVMEKYIYDENGNKRTKDYAFSIQLMHEDKVASIPCSSFYSK